MVNRMRKGIHFGVHKTLAKVVNGYCLAWLEKDVLNWA